jgi:multidrug efflux pump subunit AcrB
MNVSAWSIRNPVPAILLFILLSAIGLLAFRELGVQQFPDMDLPTIKVSASLEGAAPSQLETEVARKIEDKLASLRRLDHITTTISDGSVSISVSFEIGKDGEEALNEVRNAVSSVRANLPQSMSDPVVSKVTSQASPLLTYVIQSPRLDESDLSWLVDNDINKALLTVKGVASAERVGGVDREILVDLDPKLMGASGVTAGSVSSQLKNVQADNSGGRGDIGDRRQSIRTLGAVQNVEELGRLTLPLPGGSQVRLDQIARITDGHAERTTLAYRDGKPVVGFQIKRSNGYSDVSAANGVREAVARFQAAHPEVTITEASNTVQPIEDNYHGSMGLLYEGAILAVLVVWWFLRDARATFLSAVALPLSILPTFLTMYLLDFSLNTISLLSLSLTIGILVDDAIVEVENIARHLRMGKTPYQAAMEAADEIGLAVITTTLTLVAVFLPTAFMSGIPGIIFKQFGITAAVAVLSSLLVARLLTPMMAAYMMKPSSHVEKDGWVMRRYLIWVRACLSHRTRTMAGMALFLALSFGAIAFLKTGFFPVRDDSQTQVKLTLQPGSKLADTGRVTERAMEILRTIPEVSHVFASVGTASSGDPMADSSSADVTAASLIVDLAPLKDRTRKQYEIEGDIRKALAVIPGVRVAVGRGMNGEQLDITLASDDNDALTRAAAALESDLRTLKGVGNITSGAGLQGPEIQIRPDFARAAALGVTSTSIANTVRVATNGEYSTDMPKLNLPQRQIAIRVRFDQGTRDSLDAIRQLRLPGADGTVTLGSVADVSMSSGYAQIYRLDRYRNVTIAVELGGRAIGEVMAEAKQLPALRNLPSGVHVAEQGELQRMSELFTNFALAMAIGIFCIYAVLVLLFHDFLQPVTILAALPLSLGGALFPLVVTGTSFSMPAVIGLLMLMGIVTKNSILLVEYAILARRERGFSRFDALMDACHKRARPIVMTTIAMGAGMMPVALGLGGSDTSFRQPMATVVVGGLITSTFLSLLVIPVIFTYVDDLLQFMKRLPRLFRRRCRTRDLPEVHTATQMSAE